ncbi:hypothetical protein [Geothrix sp. 21YS21S-2]|uniref:hypothetical protein n=1 Tax=Geothrix sp. 21YS21S-2 TaxID=3068893 RepID=UPI0027B93F3C|nr:hypothetical protein [Geothrix sp. 21YS21S-2]
MPILEDAFGTRRKKKALLCGAVEGLVDRESMNFFHTNTHEAFEQGLALHESGYSVDAIDHWAEPPRGYGEYDVILGLGRALVECHSGGRRPRRVLLYSPGIHNQVQNLRTLDRVKAFRERYGPCLLESGRFASEDFTSIASLCDAVLVLGNEATAATYHGRTSSEIFIIRAFFHHLVDGAALAQRKDPRKAGRGFLWFGSAGLIHKGLDLLLEVFLARPWLELYVCGPLEGEGAFGRVFQSRLAASRNIHMIGMVRIGSPEFLRIAEQCGFAVLPSCSEGGGVSLLSAVGNGGLLPVATLEASVELGTFGIPIAGCSEALVAQAIESCEVLPVEERLARTLQAIDFVNSGHTLEMHRKSLRAALSTVLAE